MVTLSQKIQHIVAANKFREIILSFIRQKQNSAFAIEDSKGLKLLICLRLNFSHLNKYKFRYSFNPNLGGNGGGGNSFPPLGFLLIIQKR